MSTCSYATDRRLRDARLNSNPCLRIPNINQVFGCLSGCYEYCCFHTPIIIQKCIFINTTTYKKTDDY